MKTTGAGPRSRTPSGREATSRRHCTGPRRAGLWLIVQMGAARGRPVPVGGPRFFIGRHRDCQLRLGVSHGQQAPCRDRTTRRPDLRGRPGQHQRHDLNGRPLRGKEAEVHDGDRIQVGPVDLHPGDGRRQREGSAKVEEQVAEWLHGDRPAGHADQSEALDDTAVIPTSSPDAAEGLPRAGHQDRDHPGRARRHSRGGRAGERCDHRGGPRSPAIAARSTAAAPRRDQPRVRRPSHRPRDRRAAGPSPPARPDRRLPCASARPAPGSWRCCTRSG